MAKYPSVNPFVQSAPPKPKGKNPSGVSADEPDADEMGAPSDRDSDNVVTKKTSSLIKKYLMLRAKKKKKSS